MLFLGHMSSSIQQTFFDRLLNSKHLVMRQKWRKMQSLLSEPGWDLGKKSENKLVVSKYLAKCSRRTIKSRLWNHRKEDVISARDTSVFENQLVIRQMKKYGNLSSVLLLEGQPGTRACLTTHRLCNYTGTNYLTFHNITFHIYIQCLLQNCKN